MNDTGMLLTVAICTRNRADFLKKAIASVLPQLTPGAELLVVDNGSTDGTPALLAELAKDTGARFYREEKAGVSVARNTALRMARGEFVIFVDDDAVVGADWLANYRRFFLQPPHPKIGGAGGAVEPDFEVPPPRWMARCGIPEPEISRPCRPPGECPWGSNLAVRREVALAVGGFNPQLGHRGTISGAYEEGDLQDRIQLAGYEYWWVKNVGVKHFVAAARHMRLSWMLSASFRMGRCRAHRRFGRMKNGRVLFQVGRVLVGPFHCAVNLLLALVSFPLHGGRVAASALIRSSGIAGFTLELMRKW